MTPAALVLGLLLSAAPGSGATAPMPGPVAPPDARLIFHLAKPAQDVRALRKFLDPAGERAPLFRPEAIGRLFKAALGADLFDLVALDAAGVDVARPLTLSLWKGQWVACFSQKALADAPTAPTSSAGAPPLKAVGFEDRGATFQGFADEAGSWRSGRVARAGITCATSGSADQRPNLLALAANLGDQGAKKAGADLQALTRELGPAPLFGFFQTGRGLVGARFLPRGGGLDVLGRLRGHGRLLSNDARPIDSNGAAKLRAPLVLDLSLSPRALAQGGPLPARIERLIRELCPSCPADARRELGDALLAALSGQIRLAISGVDGKSPRGSLHQIRQALFLPLTEADRVRRAIDALLPHAPTREATREDAGPDPGAHRLMLDGEPVHLGVTKGALYFGNDAGLLERGIAALNGPPRARARARTAKDARLGAIHLTADGPRLANLLQGVSMFDMANGDLFAALFFLKMEASALLRDASRLELTAHPLGEDVRFEIAVDLGGCDACASKRAKPAAAPRSE